METSWRKGGLLREGYAMSHSSERIYTQTVGGKKYGVSYDDINAVLGSSRDDIGGLITYGDINAFSKKKPVVYASLNPYTNTNWWKATNGNCGLTPYSAQNPSAIAAITQDITMSGWTYTRPNGNLSTQPFRVPDFDGYYHNADPLTDGIECSEAVQSGTQLVVTLVVNQDDTDAVTLKDMALSNCYFCLYILSSDGNASYLLTGDKCDDDGIYATFDTTNVNNGDWYIYPMLSTAPIQQTNNYQGQSTFYSLPYCGAKKLTIGGVSPTHIDTVYDAALVEGTNTVEYSFRLTNTTLGNLLKGVTVKLRNAAYGYDDPLLSYESEARLGTMQAQGGTFTYSGTIQATNEILQSGVTMKLWVQFRYSGDGKQYTPSSIVAVPQE